MLLTGETAVRLSSSPPATCDLNHIMTSCTYIISGEIPSVDDIAEMKDGYLRWLSAVVDTT